MSGTRQKRRGADSRSPGPDGRSAIPATTITSVSCAPPCPGHGRHRINRCSIFCRRRSFLPLLDYYAALPGGGTREGTGYGAAIGNLIDVYRFWKDATGQDLAAITPHPADTIDYWVHATVPTRDRFAPIGDLSRESIPNLYDYHENLVHGAVVVSAGSPQAKRGTWWLQQNSVSGVAHVFNILGDLLPYADSPEQPSALMFHSPGAGALFARTSWDTDATWLSVVAGKYDQSHAHHDQGSFTFFKKDWLAGEPEHLVAQRLASRRRGSQRHSIRAR